MLNTAFEDRVGSPGFIADISSARRLIASLLMNTGLVHTKQKIRVHANLVLKGTNTRAGYAQISIQQCTNGTCRVRKSVVRQKPLEGVITRLAQLPGNAACGGRMPNCLDLGQ